MKVENENKYREDEDNDNVGENVTQNVTAEKEHIN